MLSIIPKPVITVQVIKNLYSVETLWRQQLPRMMWVASDNELTGCLYEMYAHTDCHLSRLDHLFGAIRENPQNKRHPAFEEAIEAAVLRRTNAQRTTIDLSLISASQKIIEFKAAGYLYLKSFPTFLDRTRSRKLIEQSFQEEQQNTLRLSQLLCDVSSSIEVADGVGPVKMEFTRSVGVSISATN